MINSTDNRKSSVRPRSVALLALVVAGIALAAGAFFWWQAARAASRLYERAGLQMGTFVQLRAAGRNAPAGLDAAIAELDRLEALFSYNLPGSDVTKLNAAAGKGPVELSPETITVLLAAQQIAERSGGRLDVTVGPLVDAWGFRPYFEQQTVPDDATIAAALALVDYRKLRVYPETNQAELLAPGMRVDLGAIAKGYAVDRVAEILRTSGVTSALIDIGGQVYALGIRPEGSAWRVGLQHPRESEQLLGIIPLADHSVATSGDYQRFFESGGLRYHHLLDPRTGRPAAGMASISIVAPTGMEADAISTASFILGPEAGMDLVRQLGCEAVMYTEDGQIQVTGGLQPLFEAPK